MLNRFSFALCTFTFVIPVVSAQPPRELKDGVLRVPLTIHPAPIQKLQSRFLLTPQYSESQHGNRIYGFMKAYMEQNTFFSKEQADKRYKWLDLPLADLPVNELAEVGISGSLYRDKEKDIYDKGRPLSDVDEAARLRTSDWQEWHNLRRDGIGYLLPEVQKMRELASVLKLRMRMEIKKGEFEKAIYTARTFNGLASSFESHPTLIAGLVGLAIQNIYLSTVEEYLAQPGAPNLYWGFVELYPNTVDLRLNWQGERMFVSTHFQNVLNAKRALSEDETNEALKTITMLLEAGRGEDKIKANEWYATKAKDAKAVEAARAFLVETGMKAEHVKKFTPIQAIITADLQQYEHYRDEMLKFMPLPHKEAVKGIVESDTLMKKEKEKGDLLLAPALVPTASKVRMAHTRTKQLVAYYQIIEAMRAYAHEHKKLPAKLDDIKLPIPLDPVTDKAFEYSVKDGVATLTGGDAQAPHGKYVRVFEIQLKK